MTRGRAELMVGEAERALAYLEAAEREAAALGADRVRWQIAGALAEVRAELGDVDGAAQARDAAVRGYTAVRRLVPRGVYREAFEATYAPPTP